MSSKRTHLTVRSTATAESPQNFASYCSPPNFAIRSSLFALPDKVQHKVHRDKPIHQSRANGNHDTNFSITYVVPNSY